MQEEPAFSSIPHKASVATVPGVRHCPEIVMHRAINQMHKNGSMKSALIAGATQPEFLDSVQATDSNIEVSSNGYLMSFGDCLSSAAQEPIG